VFAKFTHGSPTGISNLFVSEQNRLQKCCDSTLTVSEYDYFDNINAYSSDDIITFFECISSHVTLKHARYKKRNQSDKKCSHGQTTRTLQQKEKSIR